MAAHNPKWIAPPAGSVKVHVDAAVGRNGDRGAVAVICRNESGVYLGASAISFQEMVDPEVLEALAGMEALSLAADLGCQRVVVATDCMATITHLECDYRGPSAATIQDIKGRRHDFASVVFIHEKRELNLEAHKLSKASTTLAFGRHVWLSVLPNYLYP